MIWRVLGFTVALTLPLGCVHNDMNKIVESMATSQRSWCVTASWGGGVVRAGGSGVEGGQMECNMETFKVGNNAPQNQSGVIVIPAPPTVLQQDAPVLREVPRR